MLVSFKGATSEEHLNSLAVIMRLDHRMGLLRPRVLLVVCGEFPSGLIKLMRPIHRLLYSRS